MSVGIILGNTQAIGVGAITISPVSVAANTTAEQTFAFPGLLATDVIFDITKPSAQAGLGVVGTRVSAAGTLGITFSNNTASPIVPTASEVYQVCWMRLESAQRGVAGV